MEQAAPNGNSETADVGHCENGVVAIGRATLVPLVRQVHEKGIRDGVDDLRRIDGGIIVFFAEIEGRCLGSPDAFTGCRIGHRWQCEAHLSSGRRYWYRS